MSANNYDESLSSQNFYATPIQVQESPFGYNFEFSHQERCVMASSMFPVPGLDEVSGLLGIKPVPGMRQESIPASTDPSFSYEGNQLYVRHSCI